MELFVDIANVEAIKKYNDLLIIDGVTTNPTIIAREGKPLSLIIKEISKSVGEDKAIHVQVASNDLEGILEEAEFIQKIHEHVYVKIPVTMIGYKAIKELKARNIKTTATAIFTPHQGLLAAKAGASYLAPYVNRLDNISGDGISLVKDLMHLLNVYKFDAKVLAASFKNTYQVLEVMREGVDSVTLGPEVLEHMMGHPLTTSSVEKFTKDWNQVFGDNNKDISFE